jgi:hypothetical protein
MAEGSAAVNIDPKSEAIQFEGSGADDELVSLCF